jgi:hypothetical protein
MNDSGIHPSMDVVEDALRTYPLAPVPADLKARVMARVQPGAFLPRFAFPWLETAIGLMFSTLLTIVVTLLMEIPPAAAMRLENSVRFYFLQPAFRSMVVAAPTSAMLAILCLILAVLLFRRPTAAHRLLRR